MFNKPLFAKDSTDSKHFRHLQQLVKECLESHPPVSNISSILKAISFPLFYLSCYILALVNAEITWLFLTLYMLMGIMGVLIFLNLIHEATHGCLFNNNKINRLYLFIFDFLGPNSYIFRRRHNRFHHNYPNIFGWDTDIEQSGPIILDPHQENEKINKNQHYLVFVLKPHYLINWIFIRDFRDYFEMNRTVSKLGRIPVVEFVKMLAFKIFYLIYTVIIPYVFFQVSLVNCLLALFVLTISGSICALAVLLTPHANTHNYFPGIKNGTRMETSWFRHQLMATNDVYCNSWIAKNFLGNFHCHVAHHIFPNISSHYGPAITEVIRKYSHEHDLPYKSHTIWKSLKLHYQLVKLNAIRAKDIFSEDM